MVSCVAKLTLSDNRSCIASSFVRMSRASDAKLEEYCLVAKGSKGRTVADVIQRATSDPVLFAFGELLSLPSVQQVIDVRKQAN